MTGHSSSPVGGKTRYLVIGGGLVGASIAYGLAMRGQDVALVDNVQSPESASRANFGQLWIQGKGLECKPYRDLTIRSARSWAAFAQRLQLQTGTELFLEQRGGLHLCLGGGEFEHRAAICTAFNEGLRYDDPARMRMLRYEDIQDHLESIPPGPEVTGASFCALDGHVNPLFLWQALYAAMHACNVPVDREYPAMEIIALPNDKYRVSGPKGTIDCEEIILATGNGAPSFSAVFGHGIPVFPVRGQIMVTERVAPCLSLPTSTIRQTDNGSIMIGSTHEHVGFDDGVTVDAGRMMAQRALRLFPDLAKATLVRHWSGFRVMTPDGAPIYSTSRRMPGVSLALCHSGVGLSAFHSQGFVEALVAGRVNEDFPHFSLERFDVQDRQDSRG